MPDGRVRLPANEFRSLSPARVHAAAVAGRALGGGRGWWRPGGEYWALGVGPPGPSHHYPPVYPLYLAPYLAAFGFDPIAVQIAALLAGAPPLGSCVPPPL